jgi:hypothetical protein
VAHGEDLEPFTVVSSMSDGVTGSARKASNKPDGPPSCEHPANVERAPRTPVRDRRFLYRQTQQPIREEFCEAL